MFDETEQILDQLATPAIDVPEIAPTPAPEPSPEEVEASKQAADLAAVDAMITAINKLKSHVEFCDTRAYIRDADGHVLLRDLLML